MPRLYAGLIIDLNCTCDFVLILLSSLPFCCHRLFLYRSLFFGAYMFFFLGCVWLGFLFPFDLFLPTFRITIFTYPVLKHYYICSPTDNILHKDDVSASDHLLLG